MTEPSEDRRLFREAADLAIRLQNDPGNAVSAEMVRSWAARSARHQATWARVAEIHGMTGKVLTEQRGAGDGSDSPSRRMLVVGGLLGLGAAAAGAWSLPGAIHYARADHRTTIAEIRRVSLPDGSVMTLGPVSAIALNYSTSRRDIELLAGMAYFEVSPDPARPFSVLSGPLSATAFGTAFDVSNDAGFVSASVSHGLVEARAQDSALHPGVKLSGGDWISIDSSSHDFIRGNREASQIAAWRSGLLIVEKETVAATVTKISRWQSGTVFIADPWVRSRLVSGVFDLDNPIRALEAVVRPFGAKVRRVGSLMTVIAPL